VGSVCKTTDPERIDLRLLIQQLEPGTYLDLVTVSSLALTRTKDENKLNTQRATERHTLRQGCAGRTWTSL